MLSTKTLRLCEENSVLLQAYRSISGNESKPLQCDTGTVKSLAQKGLITDEQYLGFHARFFNKSAAVHSYGIRVAGGYQESKYYDPLTLAKAEQRKGIGSFNTNYSYMPLLGKQLFAATLSVQSAYKDFPPSTACLPAQAAGASLLTCATGAIGQPARSTTRTLDLEWRRKLSDRYAFALQLTRDLKDKVTSVAVPLYLVGNDKHGLTGGVTLSWSSDDKKVSIGVFVGKAFDVQP